MINNKKSTNDGNVVAMDQQQQIHQTLFASMNIQASVAMQ
jgi:hypothetical protein